MKKKKQRRFFSTAQKRAIIQEAIDKRSVAKVLTKYRMGDGQFYRWVKLHRPDWETVFDPVVGRRKIDSAPVLKGDADRASRIQQLERENAELREQAGAGRHLWVELKLPKNMIESLDEIAARSEEERGSVVRVILTMQLMRLQAIEGASGSRGSRAATQRR